MNRSVNKSVRSTTRAIVTLAVLATVTGTSFASHAADSFPTSTQELDGFLKSEFPTRTNARDDMGALHAGGMLIGFFTTLYSAQFEKNQNAKIKQMGAAIAEEAKVLPAHELRITLLSSELAQQEAIITAHTEFVSNPKTAVSNFQTKTLKSLDETGSRIREVTVQLAQLSKDEAQLAQVSSNSIRTNALGDIANIRSNLTAELGQLIEGKARLIADAQFTLKTGALPNLGAGVGVREATISAETTRTALTKEIAARDAILAKVDKFAITYGSKVPRVSRVRRLEKLAGLRFLGTVAGVTIFANSAVAGYTAYTLGRDPGLVPLAHFANKTYPEAMLKSVNQIAEEIAK